MNLPSELSCKKIELTDMGSNGVAWKKEHALVLLNYYKEHEVFVIGGDVLSKQGDYYKHNYDNWYFEPNEGTFNQSILKAENYIKNYPEGNYIFVLVIK